MILVLSIFTTVLVALGILTGLLYRSSKSKPRLPGVQQATPTGNNGSKNISWEKIRNAWFSAIAFGIILLCWYLISPDSMRKAVSTNEFWAGLILLAASQLVLSVYAPFEKNRLRKMLLFVFFVAGILLMAKTVFGFDVVDKAGDKFSRPTTSSSTLDETISKSIQTFTVDIVPNKWSKEIQLPSGASFRIRAPEGKLKFLFRNGSVISVNNKNDEDFSLGTVPDIVFRISGPIGQAKVFIY